MINLHFRDMLEEYGIVRRQWEMMRLLSKTPASQRSWTPHWLPYATVPDAPCMNEAGLRTGESFLGITANRRIKHLRDVFPSPALSGSGSWRSPSGLHRPASQSLYSLARPAG